jgi:tetratricopeptide (TPR) repeat protein
MRKTFLVLIVLQLLLASLAGRGQQTPSSERSQDVSGRTPFYNEAQYVVQTIVTDLAEQIFFGAAHHLPKSNDFLVSVTERLGSTPEALIYDVAIRCGAPAKDLKFELPMNGAIWSPAIYQELATQIARARGFARTNNGRADDTALITKFLDGTPETIERENQSLSQELEQNFSQPELHEKAALLLGAFALRDNSGFFWDIRPPLCRMTAHLAVARYLRDEPLHVNGQLAEALMLTQIGNIAAALDVLKPLTSKDEGVLATVRTLRALATGDPRELAKISRKQPLEKLAWFWASCSATGLDRTWKELAEPERQKIAYTRAANCMDPSVPIGHELLRLSSTLERKELSSVYELFHNGKLSPNEALNVLNLAPERCFTPGADGKDHIRVIGWGQWACFLQRHLCQVLIANFDFLQHKWGVPDEARDYSTEIEKGYDKLRLFPFVLRHICLDAKAYHTAQDSGYQITTKTPELAPTPCWNALALDKPKFAQFYLPKPTTRFNEWFKYDPLPGTLYELSHRWNHPNMLAIQNPDMAAESFYRLNPYDWGIANFLERRRHNFKPTYEQAKSIYAPLMPYDPRGIYRVAISVSNNPALKERLLLDAMKINPGYYYDLSTFAAGENERDKAAGYLEKACENDPDPLRVANSASKRIEYFLSKNNPKRAREIADEAGEVYSFAGLRAKAEFFLRTTNYTEAAVWYAKIEERYHDPWPLLNFCLGRQEPGGGPFIKPIEERLKILFPNGQEKISLRDFKSLPSDGAYIPTENQLLKSFGLSASNIIVAANGFRVHNVAQYSYLRDLQKAPEFDLIVWCGDGYRAFKPKIANHKFGIILSNYPLPEGNSR